MSDTRNLRVENDDSTESMTYERDCGADTSETTMRGPEAPLSGVDAISITGGFYILRSGVGDKVLDISGNSDAVGANAQVYHPNGTAAQIFTIDWDDALEANTIRHAGMLLEKKGDDGTGNVWQCEDTDAQGWLFEPVPDEDGWYFVRDLFGYYLDVDGAVDADGTNVKCWTFNGSAAQRWRPVPVSGVPMVRVSDGDRILRPAFSERVLDIAGDGSDVGANAQLCLPSANASQLFSIGWDRSHYANYIRHGAMFLDKEGGDGAGNVWQFPDNGTGAQRWLFEPVPDEDGWYFIRNLFGYYLDVHGKDRDGANVRCWTFDGSAAQKWKVEVPELSYATVTVAEASLAYTGEAIEPSVTVTLNGTTLARDSDYTVRLTDNTNVGTATVTVTGTGDYTGAAETTFKIEAVSLTNATVTIAETSFGYTGKAIEPAVTVELDGTTLAEGTDYDVSYADSTNVGTATVTVTGKNNYEGVTSAAYEIVTSSLDSAELTLSKKKYTFNGDARKPSTTVVLNGTTLAKGTDYDVSYADNTNVGIATVTVTGKGNYEGTAEATFKIKAIDLSAATMVLAKTSYTYTGKAILPAVKVVLLDTALARNIDYTLDYENNTSVGTATAIVTGKGNFKGTAEKTFKIKAANLSRAIVTLEKTSYAYTGKAIKPTVTVKLAGKNLVKDTDYDLSYKNKRDIGTGTVIVSGKGNYKGTAKKSFEIEAVSLSAATVIPEKISHVYTGKAIKPAVTVILDGATLTKGLDYTVAYAGNTNVGTATVTVTGKGNYKGTASATFKVVTAKLNLTKVKAQGKSVTATWEAQGGVDGYQVQCATDPEFAQIKETIDVRGASSTSGKIAGLTNGTTYYVRARTYRLVSGTRYYLSWSASKSATTK